MVVVVVGLVSLVAVEPAAGARVEGGGTGWSPRAGSLDRSFGSGGIVLTDHGGTGDTARDLLVQPDGKIVAVGSRTTADYTTDDMAVVRYDRNGRLDRRFGRRGRVVIDFGAVESAEAVLRQPDGKIVVAGTVWTQNGLYPDFALARLRTDGSLDPTFGNGGKVTTSILESDWVTSAALQRDGRIVVAGHSEGPPDGYASAVVVRYTTDGELDRSFGDGGRVVTRLLDEEPSNAWIEDLAVARDGTIVAAGLVARLDWADMVVARFRPDGTIDPRFGDGGFTRIDTTPNFELATGMALTPDGGVAVVGYADYTWNLARLRSDGILDTRFGAGGIVRTDIVGDPYDVAVQSDRKIVVTGRTAPTGDNYDATVARFRRDGTLDTRFGTNGITTTDVASGTQDANAVALQRNGDIVIAGTNQPRVGVDADFLIVRYQG
jgi:uncharacterized delta-60 repeat protein